MKIFRKIQTFYRSLFYTLEAQARHAGVTMGTQNFIGGKFWSSEGFLINIGNHCAITAGVKMFTHGGAWVARKKYPQFDNFGKIVIGNYVYIGCNSMIMPGVTIGDNVLVAAGSVVTKSIPPNVVVGGNPAKIICTVDEYIERNLKYNTDSKGMSPSEKKKLLLSIPDETFVKKQYMKMDFNKARSNH